MTRLNMPSLYVFSNHLYGKPTIVFNNWVKMGSQLFHSSVRHHFFYVNNVSKHHAADVNNALNGTADSLDLSSTSSWDNNIKNEVGDLAYKIICKLTNKHQSNNEPDIEVYRQLLLLIKDPNWACTFCEEFSSDDADMRQIILDAKDPEWAYNYCRYVKDDAEMRDVIINSGNHEWAFDYIKWVACSEDMRQVVLNAKDKMLNTNDPEIAYEYCRCVEDDEDMRQIIVDTANPKWLQCYLDDVNHNDAQIRNIVMNA